MNNRFADTGDTRARLLHLLRRSPRTITGLAEALALTDNAIRTHIASMERDGLVEHVEMLRGTGGKPARVYAITATGEELFPKAYALVLGGLVQEIEEREGRERAVELLRAVGERVAALVPATATAEERVAAAADALRELGGDLDVVETDTGWDLQGYGCPLSAVTSGHPEVCALAQALIAKVSGREVTECCDRTGRPRCAFRIAG